MIVLTPLALALALLSVPIVLMYILKLRRQQHMVSSTVLWRRALDDVQANAPWQRLRPGMLLALQLLALLAVVLALAGPAYTSSGHAAGDLILIVDESYGMQAHDVAPTRFATALAEAHSLASGLPAGNVASVIGMAALPRLAIAESSDGGAVGRAIDGLRVGDSAPNFIGALSLASSLARSGKVTRVVVLTSRESGISGLPLQVPFPVEIVRVGTRVLHDLGLAAFSAGRQGGVIRALARVGNFGGAREVSDLALYVDGQLADVRPVQVEPGRQETLFWTALPAGAHELEVRLTHADDVDADKAAWALIGAPQPRRVLLVSSGDFFVRTALSLEPDVRLAEVTPAEYHASLARTDDLVIFDGALPATLPATPVLILSPPLGRAHLSSGGAIAFGTFQAVGAPMPATPFAPSAPILQYVGLSGVHVARSRVSSLPEWMQPAVESTAGGTLLAAGESRGLRLAVTTFSLEESDWPLQISFPILVRNLVLYLAPPFGPETGNLSAGQTVRVSAPAAATEIRVVRPDGQVDPVYGGGRTGLIAFADTAQVGVYTVTANAGPRTRTDRFAVNFFPARPAPATGNRVLNLGAAPRTGGSSVALAGIPVEVGWVFALAGLVLLSAEWWFAFRR
jgi:hypothetical protein